MAGDSFAKLDNPAWWALTGCQQPFSIGSAVVKRYLPGILPFAAYRPGSGDSVHALDEWLKTGEIFYLIGELPPLPSGWTLLKELPCLQMTLASPIAITGNSIRISRLTETDSTDMFDLVNKVQPGYYEPATCRLGDYYGIRQDGRLVAIAGERMRLDGLTEISAICTDPAYTGRQYAQRLTAYLCNANLERGITPFLHVLQTNERAVGLYEYLGFRQRRMISFWQIQKTGL